MDKYEYRVKTEQMLEYTENKQYKKAMEIADTIDWRRVKSPSMLNTVSEIYEFNGEFQKSRDILFVAYDRAPESRKIIYRLGLLALKIEDTEEASDCYEEFVKVAPKDPNQFILKYKILKTQRSPLAEQIAALEDFKKAEYVEKWAYELASLYHEAGMTAKCLEECDDLILWFSEGKYVYKAMELKMKYKPLTPLQQEKYDCRPGAKPKPQVKPQEPVKPQIKFEMPVKPEVIPEPVVEEVIEETLVEEVPVEEESVIPEIIIPEPEVQEEESVEEPAKEAVESITKVVKGATLEEALANGVAMASGINIEEKAMAAKDEQLRISGQMKIDEILQAWEEKQKVNADAIAKQREEDEARLRKEREEAEQRKEAERLERERKAAAAEAARKAAEEEAARKAAEEAARKAAEEAARKAAEEAARKAAEEEAARKAAEEEAARKAAEEEARKAAEEAAKKAEEAKALEAKTQRLPDDILELVEQLESRVADSKSVYEDDLGLGLDFEEEETDSEEDFEEVETYSDEDFEDSLESVDSEEDYEEDEFEEVEEDFEEDEFEEAEEDYEEDEFEEAEEDYEEDEFEEVEEDYEEDEFEEAEEDYEEDEFEEAEEDFEEDEFEEVEEDFEDDEFEEVEDDFGEDDFGEDEFNEEDFEEATEEDDFEDDFEAAFEGFEDFDDDFGDDFEEEDFEEVEDDFEEVEDEFDEDGFEEVEDEFNEDEFEEADEEEFDLDSFFENDLPEVKEPEEPLEIEEPSEEEIQKRIKKSKGGGVPFDTGFVVTGRYDLSATSEIGLKAGLTEEQKKLFSYFVPVRGMSEKIVEVLDNDRRAQREGTSKTGNLLVIGRKGSGKTVLAVDIVKAIQKQRNLKQGKVAIVTGESLNKKELSNIIQKLRGGAIIVEKAGKLNSRTIKELNQLMEKKTGEMLFVLEDQRKPLERILTANPEFKKKFTSTLELPVFINDELVTFGQTYAKENGYKLDEMGILALYSRIDVMQREDHAVTVAEVKDIMDEAIQHSQKANVKHLARRVFGKSTDHSDRIILKEEDFKI